MGFTMTTGEIIKFLKDHGFTQESGGRHQIHMVKGRLRIPVPAHSGDVAKGTVAGLLRLAGYTADDVMKWRG